MAIRPIVLFLLFLAFSGTLVFGQGNILNQSVEMSHQSGTVEELLEALGEAAEVRLAWSPRHLRSQRKVALTGREESLHDHLQTILDGEYVRIVVRKNRVILARAMQPLHRPEAVLPQRKTVRGLVRERGSGEALIGAAVYVAGTGQGTYTNDYGFFSLTMPEGVHQLNFQYVGYAPQRQIVDFSSTEDIEVRMEPNLEITGVEINSEEKTEEIHDHTLMGKHSLSMEKEGVLPVLLGEADVLKTMQLLPGVHGGMDGSVGFFVRGGGADQNLINLDGVPVYNASHAIGVVSVFNSSAITSASIQKGAFPARYAGRLSSLVDIRMREGNMEEIRGEVGMGLLSGRISVEGPIAKNKTSFFVSARRTWLDLLVVPLQALATPSRVSYFFHDFNGKINHRISKNDRIYLSGYFGRDKFRLRDVFFQVNSSRGDDNTEIGWGNQIASLRWNHIFGPRLFSNTTLTYSRYKFSLLQEIQQDSDSSWFQRFRFDSRSSIQDWAGRVDFDFFYNPRHTLHFGGGNTYHTFDPSANALAQVFLRSDSSFSVAAEKKFAHESFVYLDDVIKLSDRLHINPGLHLASYFVGNQNYFSPQPRFSSRYKIDDKTSLKFSYGRMVQFIHLLTNPSIGVPVDLWVPSTEKVKPAVADQLSLGFYRTIGSMFSLRSEVFYKQMYNLLEYREGYNYIRNSPYWETNVERGSGRSYGVEVMLEKHSGKLSGWLSYTLAKADRQFDNLNFGKRFPFRYDRRHDINAAFTYKVNKKLSFGGVWIFGTGNAATVGLTRFIAMPNLGTTEGIQVVPVEERNNFRTPAYHRLDIALNLDKYFKKGERRWSFGVYNVYNRINPTFIFAYTQDDGSANLVKRGLIPVLPFVSYRRRF